MRTVRRRRVEPQDAQPERIDAVDDPNRDPHGAEQNTCEQAGRHCGTRSEHPDQRDSEQQGQHRAEEHPPMRSRA